MGELSLQTRKQIAATASRLRAIQIENGEQTSAAREDLLVKEIKERLAKVDLSEHRGFLEELTSRFPTWEDKAAQAPARAAPPPSMDLQTMVRTVAEQVSRLPEAQRNEVLGQLRQVWGLPASSPPNPKADHQLLGAWRMAAGIQEGQTVNPQRCSDLLVRLLELVQVLDPLVNRVWRKINPRSPARQVDWRELVSSYLRNDPKSALPAELMHLRQLIATLVSVLPDLAERLYHDHLMPLRPQDIEQSVRDEGWSLTGIQARSWQRYQQMADALEVAAVRAALAKIIMDVVEPIL